MPSQRDIEIARLRGDLEPEEVGEVRPNRSAGMRLPVTWPPDPQRRAYLEGLAAAELRRPESTPREGPFPIDWRAALEGRP
jgi:hypothetical protein